MAWGKRDCRTDGHIDGHDGQVVGLTCALLQLDAAAHVDVIYSDVASSRVIKETLEHHLEDRRRRRKNITTFIKHILFSNTDTN